MGGIDFISTLLSACVGTIGRLYLLHREKKTKRKVGEVCWDNLGLVGGVA